MSFWYLWKCNYLTINYQDNLSKYISYVNIKDSNLHIQALTIYSVLGWNDKLNASKGWHDAVDTWSPSLSTCVSLFPINKPERCQETWTFHLLKRCFQPQAQTLHMRHRISAAGWRDVTDGGHVGGHLTAACSEDDRASTYTETASLFSTWGKWYTVYSNISRFYW